MLRAGLRERARALAFAACALAACDDEPKAPPVHEAPPDPSGVAAALGVDAGALGGVAVDPPAPAGDLKAELDAFVNLDACVARRQKVDPLVGDALEAIGYDTLLRDACRLLEASKDRRAEACDAIDSSALRARCRSWVARIAQTPDACPLVFASEPSRGREPSCVALAGKDPRLCAGVAGTSARATCEALATRDARKCDALLPRDRAECQRQVTRWRSLLPAPLEGLPKLPAARAKLTVKGAGTTPNPAKTEGDLTSDFARGAVVTTWHDDRRVALGVLGESDLVRFAPSPNARARVGVDVVARGAKPDKGGAGGATLARLELAIPGEATLVYDAASSRTGARCDCRVTRAQIDGVRGGLVDLAVEGTISAGTRSYAVALELTTFVRDVAKELPKGALGVPRGHALPSARPLRPR